MLGCVPGLSLKRYYKTLKLVKKYSTRHVFYQSKSNRHLGIQGWSQTQIWFTTTCMFIKFRKVSDREYTWIACIIDKIPLSL